MNNDELGEITFSSFKELKDLLKLAWESGKLEQSNEDLKKEKSMLISIAKKLKIVGINDEKFDIKIGKINTFDEWFLDSIKDRITKK